MAAAGLEAPVIAISALAVPLLFLVYVFEIDPLETRFVLPTAVIFGFNFPLVTVLIAGRGDDSRGHGELRRSSER